MLLLDREVTVPLLVLVVKSDETDWLGSREEVFALELKTSEVAGVEFEELGPEQKPLTQVLKAHWSLDVQAA